jgi:hypothetical protein
MYNRLILLVGTIGFLAACSDVTGPDARTGAFDPPADEVQGSDPGRPAPKK